MNSITDPLAQQKTQASNIGLNNYQNASTATPSLQNYYNQNFGQNQQQTLAGMNPMFQDIYGSLMKDVGGGGGPFSDLKQNLLGSFDAGQANAAKSTQQQLQAQGLGDTGAGMAVAGQQGVDAAQQRALLGSQADTQMMSMADQISQQLTQQNQQQGFQNPMSALQQIYQLSQAPNFQNVDNSYYTPAPKDSGFQQGFGDVMAAANAVSSIMSGMPSSGGGGSPTTGQSANPLMTNNGAGFASPNNMNANYYGPAMSQINSPLMLAAMGR